MNVDYCSEQPPTPNPGTPPIISFRLVFIVAAALLVLDVAVIYLVADSGLRLVFSDLIIPLTNLLAVALLYLAGRQAARTYGTPFGRPWFWWMAAFIS
jgi:hypothetical protein